jgi:hypothetical protein
MSFQFGRSINEMIRHSIVWHMHLVKAKPLKIQILGDVSDLMLTVMLLDVKLDNRLVHLLAL